MVEGLQLATGDAAVTHDSYGGGLYIGDSQSVVLDDTFDHDVAADAGGAIFAAGPVTVTNSTFYLDTAQVDPTTSTDFPTGGADVYTPRAAR